MEAPDPRRGAFDVGDIELVANEPRRGHLARWFDRPVVDRVVGIPRVGHLPLRARPRSLDVADVERGGSIRRRLWWPWPRTGARNITYIER